APDTVVAPKRVGTRSSSAIIIPDYTAITHVDADNAFAAGRGGVLMRTTDRGDSWDRIDFAFAAVHSSEDIALGNIVALAFTDRATGCAIDDRGAILYTTDGGATWNLSRDNAGARQTLNALVAVDKRFIAVGANGSILQSTNKGAAWSVVHRVAGRRQLRSVRFIDQARGYAVGDSGTVIRTSDGGRTWSAGSTRSTLRARDIAFLDATRGMIVGDSGSSFVTSDGGSSWQRSKHRDTDALLSLVPTSNDSYLTLGQFNTLFDVASDGATWVRLVRPLAHRRSYAFATTTDGLSVRSDGVVQRTRDGGLSWHSVDIPSRVPMTDVAFRASGRAIVVGDDVALHSEDRGTTWKETDVPRAVKLSDVDLHQSGSAWALGEGPTVLGSSNGGLVWSELIAPASEPRELGANTSDYYAPTTGATNTSLFALNGLNIWALAGDTLLRTSDGGRSWRGTRTPAWKGVAGNLFFASENVGWCGGDGSVWQTSNGGASWTQQSVPASARIIALHFDDLDNGWGVGERGTIIATMNGGAKWSLKPTAHPTNDALISVTRVDGNLVASGMLGTVLTSDDDGDTWSQPEYAWLPAPWFYAALLALVAIALALRSRKGQAQSAPTIADILSNDRPLEAGEHDALDLGSRALHLSAFIRNRKTEPPMTFAVTGKWGSGKSSLMNLLKSDLVRHGHRPVWFNAWHHQGEQHLLAALFENVRRQAIPPIANLLGA
ncbi:MAG: hypothetical protein H7X80_08140, partial [bacterium]|nr:hypothetical protein [Candidatus Kapabacteria bacterium]